MREKPSLNPNINSIRLYLRNDTYYEYMLILEKVIRTEES